MAVTARVVHGDLLDLKALAIVNPWNRNWVPWWLLPQGVSVAIRPRAGLAPFRALGRRSPIPPGGAVCSTGRGRLPQRAILDELPGFDFEAEVRVVRFRPAESLQ